MLAQFAEVGVCADSAPPSCEAVWILHAGEAEKHKSVRGMATGQRVDDSVGGLVECAPEPRRLVMSKNRASVFFGVEFQQPGPDSPSLSPMSS